MRSVNSVLLAILITVALLNAAEQVAAEPVMKTESFANSTEGFIGCEIQIRAKRAGNLLAGGGVGSGITALAAAPATPAGRGS
mgnify:CR=1 FL=1